VDNAHKEAKNQEKKISFTTCSFALQTIMNHSTTIQLIEFGKALIKEEEGEVDKNTDLFMNPHGARVMEALFANMLKMVRTQISSDNYFSSKMCVNLK